MFKDVVNEAFYLLNNFVLCYKFYLQCACPIQEFVQTLLQFFDRKPICMESHHVRRLILLIISTEIFLQPFENVFGIMIMQNTLIQIRTVTSFEVLDVMRV